MAKRKRRSAKKAGKNKKSKKQSPKHEAPAGFGRAVFLYLINPLIVLLLFLGSFGAGGGLPVGMFDMLKNFFGVVAYVIPWLLALALLRIYKSEYKRLPLAQLIGTFAVLVASSGFFHAATVSSEESLAAADRGEGGGMIGHTVIGALDSFLASWVAAIVLLVCAIVAAMYVMSVPFERFVNSIAHLFGHPERPKKNNEDGNKIDLKVKVPEKVVDKSGFKLNEGVPLQRAGSNLKNTAKKMTEVDDAEALTMASDPNWEFPSMDVLDQKQDQADAGDVKGNAQVIQDTMGDFNINVEMEGANIGPRVTQYTLKPPSGVKLTKITSLENNLALNLAAQSIRVEAPIPGKRLVGIEVPNNKSANVRLHNIFVSREWKQLKDPLGFGIGKDIGGESVVGALNKMPHLLVAGATGSGKSVMVNALLTSLLYRNSPNEMKLILVDPKQVELTPYSDIPHLLTPVITEPEKCISALKWAVAEMERRYTLLAEAGKRNIDEYNKTKADAAMPYIVIVIDELADLMMIAARDVEALIVRLAQKARAIGIHLVLATQRPSVDVITGLIKANIPARIAFTVASQVDSRTILDQGGAEKLLGLGDMLFSTPQLPKPRRVQGVFVSDAEVLRVTDHLRMQRPPEYDEEIVTQRVDLNGKGSVIADLNSGSDDAMYEDAVRVVIEGGKASASMLQRRLRVGYARAARLIETMEEQGLIGPADGARPREVLVSSMDAVFGNGAEDEANADYNPDPNEQ